MRIQHGFDVTFGKFEDVVVPGQNDVVRSTVKSVLEVVDVGGAGLDHRIYMFEAGVVEHDAMYSVVRELEA